MQDKYNMTQEQNVFLAKRNIVDSIWKSAHIEGIDVTFPETQEIFEGRNVARLDINALQTINNLKHAWYYILNSINADNNMTILKSINALVGSNLVYRAGEVRIYDVKIGGTNWTPELPNEKDVQKKIEELSKIECITDRAISIMCYLMRTQLFSDGNKRTSMLFANKILIQNGKGIISIPTDKKNIFGNKLIEYYETNNMENLKQWIYENALEGITFPE